MSEEEVERVMRAGVTGPCPPSDGSSVDVEMDECPSCGFGRVAGRAWLIRSGKNKGTICIRCRVCYETLLGRDESGAVRDISSAGVAGATNMILRAIEGLGAELYGEAAKEPKNNSRCPNCGSEDVEGGAVDICENAATQPCSCLECDATWVDTYVFDGVDELRVAVAE